MVWFGKHIVAYVAYVPAALAGLLLPYAWAFSDEAAAAAAAAANKLTGLSGSISLQLNGQAANGMTNGHGTTNGQGAKNGATNGQSSDYSLATFVAARLKRKRLPAALLGG